MINEKQFEELKGELCKIKNLPLGWGGRRQNNADDDKIDLFSINTYAELTEAIKDYDESTRKYYLKRWYVIKVADCDEYLLSTLPNTERNPDKYSKRFDFIMNGHKFDIKGTRIPLKFQGDFNRAYKAPINLIRFYYYEQSRGRRYGVQNRLFIVTVDEDNPENEIYLRRDFETKLKAFKKYLRKLKPNRNLFYLDFDGDQLDSDIIFIIKKGGEIKIEIASDIIN